MGNIRFIPYNTYNHECKRHLSTKLTKRSWVQYVVLPICVRNSIFNWAVMDVSNRLASPQRALPRLNDKSDQLFTTWGRGCGLANSDTSYGFRCNASLPKTREPDVEQTVLWFGPEWGKGSVIIRCSPASSQKYILLPAPVVIAIQHGTLSSYLGVPQRGYPVYSTVQCRLMMLYLYTAPASCQCDRRHGEHGIIDLTMGMIYDNCLTIWNCCLVARNARNARHLQPSTWTSTVIDSPD